MYTIILTAQIIYLARRSCDINTLMPLTSVYHAQTPRHKYATHPATAKPDRTPTVATTTETPDRSANVEKGNKVNTHTLHRPISLRKVTFPPFVGGVESG